MNDSKNTISFREFFSLLGLNCVVLARNLKEFINVSFCYYSNSSFLKADLSLRLIYLFHNPFSISKRFLMAKGESDIYAYGETPLTTLETIAKECHITKKDTVFELGCGRGRTCFWLNCFIGCKVVGIEFIPDFVERGNRIKNRLKMNAIQFRQEDMFEADYTGATVCYLYGTCLDDQSVAKLIDTLSTLPVGTKVITVSYPLSDYTDKLYFEVMKAFTGTFTWGEAEVYLQVVKHKIK